MSPLRKAKEFLASALKEAKTPLEIAGTIQAFEFCYELTWKILKKVLFEKGVQVNSPREVFRAAAAENLIQDLETWYTFIEKQNLTTHVYNEMIANDIYNSLPEFSKLLNSLFDKLLTL